jgi:serine/threonine protein kinase
LKKIGKYKICGLLGRGGMGKVYKVEMPVIGKIAALKLLDPNPLLIDLLGAETIQQLFISEAITMARLRHPNIVKIWDFDETNGKPFYTMEYYGNNLGTIIGETYKTEKPSRIIKIDKAINYTRQTLSGLACLHYAGVVHRDIKPYNILLAEDDAVKICDFGLSKLRGESYSGPSNLKVGSPWYAAPEQEDDADRVDFRSDIYSVGVMLYRMLTGSLPLKGFNPPSRCNPDLDEAWDAFMQKAIAPKFQNRFASTKEMIQALDELYAAWEEKKEKICALSDSLLTDLEKSQPASVPKPIQLRKQSLKIDPRRAKKTFSTDPLWRPLTFIQNDFKTNSNDTVTDRITGLVWQQGGTDYPVTWNQAGHYIERLNKTRFAGYNNWRLPTVDELMSILTNTPHGNDYCIESAFDQNQQWLWSSDRRSYMAAWYVSFEMGFVTWQDFSGSCHAKAVCEE